MPKEAIAYIQLCENCSLKPYLDSEGIATIGWGSTFYEDNRRVTMDDPAIRQSYADALFLTVLKGDFWEPLKSVPHWEQMGDGTRSALLSFAYNRGYRYGHEDFNTLNGVLKNRNWNDLGRVLILYRNPGSNSELGLARRRYGESLLARGALAKNAFDKAWGMNSVKDILRAIA